MKRVRGFQPRQLHATDLIVHVVATDNFAGVEQYISYVAGPLTDLGWKVVVIGGDAAAMRNAIGSRVEHRAASTSVQVGRELARAGRAAVVHAHMTAAELAAVLTIPWTRAPVVVTRHFAATRGSSLPVRIAGTLIGRIVRRQISISEFVASEVGEPSIVIANGVPDREMGTHDERVVLVAQRFEAEKETGFALRTWAASGLGAEGWQMLIAGRGAEEDHLRALTRELGIAESVRFLGFVDDLPARMASAAVFWATAPREPFGLSVAEAMACGCAVLAVDGGAHRELLGDCGEFGLVPHNDVERAAAMLRRLTSDGALCREVGASLRSRQRSHFSIDVHVRELESVYREVARDRNGRRGLRRFRERSRASGRRTHAPKIDLPSS